VTIEILTEASLTESPGANNRKTRKPVWCADKLGRPDLYCCDAQWSGFYDRMFPQLADEMEGRLALAAGYDESLNA
jgi:hypothetical protein